MRHLQYVIVDTLGNIVWEGDSEGQCATEWVPGTYWGSGLTRAQAYGRACVYVEKAKERKYANVFI